MLGAAEGSEAGARWTAVKELQEGAGLSLPPECFFYLPSAPAEEHGGRHINFAVRLEKKPCVRGPDHRYESEVQRGGMDGIGDAAEDGVHAWVSLEDLLCRSDLLSLCRAPIQGFLTMDNTCLAEICTGQVDNSVEPCEQAASSNAHVVNCKIAHPLEVAAACAQSQPIAADDCLAVVPDGSDFPAVKQHLVQHDFSRKSS